MFLSQHWAGKLLLHHLLWWLIVFVNYPKGNYVLPFLLLKPVCFEQLNSYKRARFFWEFELIFSCAKNDVKIWLESLWQRFRKFPVKLEYRYLSILVLFWYIVHVCSAYMLIWQTLSCVCIAYVVTCKYICWFKLLWINYLFV